jgi:CBS domain-containing protein
MDLKANTQTPLSQVLASKGRGSSTLTTSPDVTVAAAADLLVRNKVGSVLVMDQGRLVGIFTERDVLRLVAERRDPASTRIADVMTRDLVVMRPSSSVVDAMRVISEKRIRHIPVVEGGAVLGVVSQGDLNHWLVRNREGQIQDLVDFVTGKYPA